MSPKKKESASTSGSSSSNSSSSSSSSGSSSSGSDSSSSDSEGSSSSGGKSGNRTSDSDKKQSPKKKLSTSGGSASKTKETEDKSKKVTRPPIKTSSLFSSDSEDSSRKNNGKRKSVAKPKATATVTPKVTSSTKNTPRPVPKAKVIPKKPPPSSVKSTTSKPPDAPKHDSEEKKLKTKSIFSPDNSSDSEDDATRTPPPKLNAMKAAATKTKPKLPEKPPTRSSSVSSNSSNSSDSSDSSSGSSSTDKAGGGGGNGGGGGSSGSAPAPTPRGRGRPPKRPQPSKTSSEDQSQSGTRKQTRSSNLTRRSRHSSRLVTDSDSDTGSKTSASRSPSKKVNTKGGVRKQKGAEVNHVSHIPECEDKRCPLDGCDSLGHLNGKLDKHFSLDACPTYHNLTAQECRDMMVDRKKKEEERNRAHSSLKRNNATSPTPEQKSYKEKVKEMRLHSNERLMRDRPLTPRPDRLPDVSHYSNKYDFKLFQEAQALAAEIAEEEMKELAQYRATKYIEMGKFEMEVWYQSPYPEDFARSPKLYICEYCLRYMKSRNTLERHSIKCAWRHPPGEEVYRKDKISMWEVDGKRFKTYCQNLCLLAKFFLDHKTLYYDVEPFLFYVMTSGDSEGCHTVGYFSKEKNSQLNYNVSCILTLPPYQRQGYGRLLIDFSYLLTRVEGKVGSPEKPLSDLGLISYRSYWKDVLLSYLCNFGGKILSIKDISQEMAISTYDIVSTLQALGMIKYWKGKHIVLKKQDVIEEYLESSKKLGQAYREIDPKCLKWRPFVPASPHSS